MRYYFFYKSFFLYFIKKVNLGKKINVVIRAKVSLTYQNSKPPKDNLSKDERKEEVAQCD